MAINVRVRVGVEWINDFRDDACRQSDLSYCDDQVVGFLNAMGDHGHVKDVQDVRLGYFEEGWRSAQRFLQPAYVLLGTIGSADQPARRKLVYVTPALVRAVGRITPPLARKPVPRRRVDGRRAYNMGAAE